MTTPGDSLDRHLDDAECNSARKAYLLEGWHRARQGDVTSPRYESDAREWIGNRPTVRLIVAPRQVRHGVKRILATMVENQNDSEIAAAKREDAVRRREAGLSDRQETAEVILEAAEMGDVEADIRDDAVAKRDEAADLAAFVHPEDGDSYVSDNPRRRHAALDRGHAKDDRAWAAHDRDALTEDPDANASEGPEGGPTRT